MLGKECVLVLGLQKLSCSHACCSVIGLLTTDAWAAVTVERQRGVIDLISVISGDTSDSTSEQSCYQSTNWLNWSSVGKCRTICVTG